MSVKQLILTAIASTTLLLPSSASAQPDKWWGSQVDAALEKSGDNVAEWQSALATVPARQRAGLEFLLANMPTADLQSLQAARILKTLELAYRVRGEIAWGKTIPEEIFLNDVLPYCSIDEPRDPWREDFYQRFRELALSCKTAGEAAQRLNSDAFQQLKVKYSTKRKRAIQSPQESIDQGLASCTGLSILLVDACRAVGVPARLAGIAKWPNKNGNHTWVEIWDGDWHFVGAAEPATEGLDHAWFVNDAALAQKDSPESSIRAVSYRKTDENWPLVLARDSQVFAVNVTDRYAKNRQEDAANTACRLLVRVVLPNGERVASVVSVVDAADPRQAWSGNSSDESQDTNDILAFEVTRNRSYRIQARLATEVAAVAAEIGDTAQSLVTLELPAAAEVTAASKILAAAAAWFAAEKSTRQNLAMPAELDGLVAVQPAAVRDIVWQAYVTTDRHGELQSDFAESQIQSAEHLSPWVARNVGKRPPNGWPLFIAMHGGGGAPKQVNDSQWRHMQIYYRDQNQLPGYRYLALRAPNDSWNGFYTDYVYPLIHRLIVQQVLFADVDPNRVFIMGYSHGGYGAFAIGPKMPDHFAAIHSSAAAPTDGETVPDTLRNTRFTYMIGAKDTHYGRAERCQKFHTQVQALRGERTDIFPVTMEWKTEHGHGGLPDRNKISTMYGQVRHVTPRTLNWLMSDGVIRDFFWLSCDQPTRGQRIDASCQENRVELQLDDVRNCTVWLDERLIDWQRPVTVQVTSGTVQTNREFQLQPSLRTLCQSMEQRADRDRSYSAAIDIAVSDEGISLRPHGDPEAAAVGN